MLPGKLLWTVNPCNAVNSFTTMKTMAKSSRMRTPWRNRRLEERWVGGGAFNRPPASKVWCAIGRLTGPDSWVKSRQQKVCSGYFWKPGHRPQGLSRIPPRSHARGNFPLSSSIFSPFFFSHFGRNGLVNRENCRGSLKSDQAFFRSNLDRFSPRLHSNDAEKYSAPVGRRRYEFRTIRSWTDRKSYLRLPFLLKSFISCRV